MGSLEVPGVGDTGSLGVGALGSRRGVCGVPNGPRGVRGHEGPRWDFLGGALQPLGVNVEKLKS